MIRDNYATQTELENSLKRDSLKRNHYLANLIRTLNSTKKHTVYALDGGWGSGKTFFVKQLQFASNNPQNFTTLSKDVIEEFNNNYSIFYFNAWEHDNLPALESVIFSLSKMAWGGWELVANTVVNIAEQLIDFPVKVLSGGTATIEDLKASYIKQYIENADKTYKASKEVCNLIDNYKDRTGKRVLFIIDDLDRCCPSYAIELLESIKHCFNCNGAIFLVCANNRQLQHTVKKYYGEGFDGYGYLDRFYDLIFSLPEPDLEAYVKYCLEIENPDYIYNETAIGLAKVFNMSLRQVNRYISDLMLISDFLEGNSLAMEGNHGRATKNAFIQIASALKIMDPEKFDSFVSGKGVKTIKELATRCEELTILDRSLGGNTGNGNALIPCYNELFRPNSIKAHQSAEAFRKAATSMGFPVIIDEE